MSALVASRDRIAPERYAAAFAALLALPAAVLDAPARAAIGAGAPAMAEVWSRAAHRFAARGDAALAAWAFAQVDDPVDAADAFAAVAPGLAAPERAARAAAVFRGLADAAVQPELKIEGLAELVAWLDPAAVPGALAELDALVRAVPAPAREAAPWHPDLRIAAAQAHLAVGDRAGARGWLDATPAEDLVYADLAWATAYEPTERAAAVDALFARVTGDPDGWRHTLPALAAIDPAGIDRYLALARTAPVDGAAEVMLALAPQLPDALARGAVWTAARAVAADRFAPSAAATVAAALARLAPRALFPPDATAGLFAVLAPHLAAHDLPALLAWARPGVGLAALLDVAVRDVEAQRDWLAEDASFVRAADAVVAATAPEERAALAPLARALLSTRAFAAYVDLAIVDLLPATELAAALTRAIVAAAAAASGA